MLSPMDNNELVKLISRYLSGDATIQETEFVERYYNYFDLQVDAAALAEEEVRALAEEMRKAIEERIEKAEKAPVVPLYKRKWWRITAAAAFILFITTGVILYMNNKSSSPQKELAKDENSVSNDILPGGNKATLTLADGSIITLDTAKNGRLADQDAATILKVADGQLAYDAIEQASSMQYNTLSTPKGGQYALTLPDGSKAWLNALSTIRFPTAFLGHERLVEITGEVYFEIAKDPLKPFIASTNGVKIEALGTQFNVNAYKDEAYTTTTLIEGVVRVTNEYTDHTIHPGEQVVIQSGTGQAELNKDVNVEEVMAWKNGLTVFRSMDIQSIMRQLSRWYDVNIVYQGNIPPQRFTGKISRYANLSEVLSMLEYAGIHFKIEDRNIVVLP